MMPVTFLVLASPQLQVILDIQQLSRQSRVPELGMR